jgi:HK97 family phage major capsid protein
MSDEIKVLADGIKSDFENFKKSHTELLKAKAEGKSVSDLEQKVQKLNDAIDAKTERLDKIETALKRTQQGGSEHNAPVTEKVLRKAFKDWMSKGAANSTLADAVSSVFESKPELKAAYIEEHPEMKALAVSDDTQGGFMVHADLTGRIVKRIFETSPIRQYAAVTTISTDALEGPRDFDQATAQWVAETGSRSQTANPKIGMWRIPTHELYAEPATTQKLLDDAAWDPESWLANKVADKFARTENAAFVSGDGVGKPKGFLAETTISDANGASASYDSYLADAKIGYIPTGKSAGFPDAPSAASDGAVLNPVLDAIYALKTQYRDQPGTAFAMHRTTIAAVRKLRDNYGRYMWEPGLGGQPSTLFGYAIAEFNDMPVIAANSLSIAFANWREAYQIVDRIGIRILRDPYTAKPFILFYTTKRTGGATLNHEAIKLIKFAAS